MSEQDLFRVLEEIRDNQKLQLERQAKALELQREQFSLVQKQYERAERLQDRAEQIQAKSAIHSWCTQDLMGYPARNYCNYCLNHLFIMDHLSLREEH